MIRTGSPEPSVRELIVRSTRKVVDGAEHLRLDPAKIEEFAERIPQSLSQNPTWDKERHFCDQTEQTAQWLFVLNTIKFSFWPDKGQERWVGQWQGEPVRGFWALACSLNLAMKRGLPITEVIFLEQIDAKSLEEMLGGVGNVPMIEERAKALNEIGAILRQKYDGNFINLLEEAQTSVENVVRLVVSDFPSFNDVTPHGDDIVYLYKRAQILCSDLWGAFDGKGPGAFRDINLLTAFADYKLPQLLRSLGIIEYNHELAEKVDSLTVIPAGSNEEIEIRAATVCAVEELVEILASKGTELPAFAVDWWLWEISHEERYEKRPHHRTRTHFY
jgi:hypothetical protein